MSKITKMHKLIAATIEVMMIHNIISPITTSCTEYDDAAKVAINTVQIEFCNDNKNTFDGTYANICVGTITMCLSIEGSVVGALLCTTDRVIFDAHAMSVEELIANLNIIMDATM